MKKKIIVPAIVSIFFLVVVLLIRSNKKQSSIAVPEITLVYAENQVEDYPTSKVLMNLHVLSMKKLMEELR